MSMWIIIMSGLTTALGAIACAFSMSKAITSALEGTARQPEAGPALRTTMIIAAALIEGLGFLALVICFFAVMNLAMPKGEAAPAGAQVEAHK